MMHDLETLRHQSRLVQRTVGINLDGFSHEESLVHPEPAGNCANWVLGHLLAVYNDALPVFGQQPLVPATELARYARGSQPILNADEAIPLDRLLQLWNDACERVSEGLSSFPTEALGAPAPFSPRGDATETVGSLMSTIVFHQSYHAGQLGVLRRIAGKERGIA